ncbi:polysaccharide lyase family protein [Micromonospora sp. NPDC050417]|uniref:polysaccharide lyase family protein n=1 Tax=Micromonospora sp. NPDC050417 TaxID=3364280 RepID=UPI0037AE10D6
MAAEVSRRTALGLMGAAAAAPVVMGRDAAWAAPTATNVRVLINGVPAAPGNYPFPGDIDTLVLDNGLIRFTFGRDDAAGGIVTGWTDVSITATSIVVDGVELAHNLNGTEPRDPDRQHSFYVDAGGGTSRLVCTEVRVLRASADLVEVAFVDNTSPRLRHEHHLIMRRGKRGLYGYDILTAVVAQSINEVRMNARWDRSILDHAFNWERGKGQQPTYAYLETQVPTQDEARRVDGVNNPDLPSPESNSGNLPAGSVYSKYDWSLYHHENPMFGHYGHGFGAWFTPLGGVTDQTLCAFYGVGPNHQDLAIHQDALILNYFGANHYGLPAYPLFAGYQRLYGPWYTFVNTGDPDDPDAMIAKAAKIAKAEIEENRGGSDWIKDPFYPRPHQRTTVTGRLRIADGRPAGGYWVLLSTQDVTDVYTIHEPTYFVKTAEDGSFSLPGIPPAWQPGTRTPGTYNLYAFAATGSVTDQLKLTGITVGGARQDLGKIEWAPTNHTTFLWQIGSADRMGGEFALATDPKTFANPRNFEKPAQVPGTLTFTIGESWEPQDWYYAQTNAGTWTVAFELDRSYTGTAYLTVSSSMQRSGRPTVAVNGSATGITGSLPNNNDSTIARQADRSGFPRLATLSFPASMLTVGTNTITFTRGAGTAAGDGLGWDTLLLEVDEDPAVRRAQLAGRVTRVVRNRHGRPGPTVWTVEVTNTGRGAANDVRLDSFAPTGPGKSDKSGYAITSRDPGRFPVPVAASIPPGGTATFEVAVDFSGAPNLFRSTFEVRVSANGGRAQAAFTGR